jgi:hypothetical protein
MGEIIAKFCSPKEVDEPGSTRNDVKRTKKKVEFTDTKCSEPLAFAFDGGAVYSPN